MQKKLLLTEIFLPLVDSLYTSYVTGMDNILFNIRSRLCYANNVENMNTEDASIGRTLNFGRGIFKLFNIRCREISYTEKYYRFSIADDMTMITKRRGIRMKPDVFVWRLKRRIQ